MYIESFYITTSIWISLSEAPWGCVYVYEYFRRIWVDNYVIILTLLSLNPSPPRIRLNATEEWGFAGDFDVAWEPLMERKILSRRHMWVLVESPMTSADLSFLLSAIFPAACSSAWWHSSPIKNNNVVELINDYLILTSSFV